MTATFAAAEREATRTGHRAPRRRRRRRGGGFLAVYSWLVIAYLVLPIFVMVANDGAWGSSRNITLRQFNGTTGVELAQNHYERVAEGLDCHGELASSPAEVGPAFDRAIAATEAGQPALVNVLVDPDTGAERRDPLLQMITFNPARFGGA